MISSQHAPAEYRELVQQIYLAYFGRPADVRGLAFWMQVFSDRAMPLQAADLAHDYANGGQVKQVIDLFVNSPESQALYTGNNQAFLNAIYRNVFNRNAEPDGLAFWSGFLERKELTRGQVVLHVLIGAQNDDAVIEKKKVQASLRFSASVEARGASAILNYGEDDVNQAARELLGLIGADTDLDAFQSQIDALIDELGYAPSRLPVVSRYSGFHYLQDAQSSEPAYAAYYKYADHGIVPFTSGTLTYGVVPQTISWTRTLSNGEFSYGSPITASIGVALQGGMPAAAMLCQANGTVTDILVANWIHPVTDASELANQTFGIYRENCALANANGKSLVFDANGAASGVAGTLKAYRYTSADGAKRFVIVQHQGRSLGLWSQQ